MFSGIVEAMGEVVRASFEKEGASLRLRAPFAAELLPGQSVAVDGSCLTVREAPRAGLVAFDLSPSTLRRTIAGSYRPGDRVNLERGIALGARLDGHLVQGHVDDTAKLLACRARGNTRFLRFQLAERVRAEVIPRGSVALNGVSLTASRMDEETGELEVAIVPSTWSDTNLGRLSVGDPVNVEADMIGKYVRRALASRGLIHPGTAS